MNKVWIGLSIVLAAFLHTHLVDQSYWQGYEDAEMRLGTTAEQCYQYWFGDVRRYEQEMRQFCKQKVAPDDNLEVK
jgi:flagellar biosynthesis protein FliP